MKKIFFSILLFGWGTSNAQSDSCLTFSEIMFYPNGSNSEYIEIFNTSAEDSIDLENFKIYYHTSTADLIIAHNGGSILDPHSYAVIFEGDYDFDAGQYNSVIPNDALILKINNGAFGSSGMANSTARQLTLVSEVNDTLDVYAYTANNSMGISDEKILMNKSNEISNWGNSTSNNGTPGAPNTVSPWLYDLAISGISFTPTQPFAGTDIQITVQVKNVGLNEASNFSITLFEDADLDSTGQPDELINSQQLVSLSSGDSMDASFMIGNVENKIYNLLLHIDYDRDMNLLNNTGFHSINVAARPADYNDIVINEIMYRPLNDEPEWIEVINRSAASLNLREWSISDKSSKVKLSGSDIILEPHSYLVICDDSTLINYYDTPPYFVAVNIPSLNNSGDEIKLIDNFDRVIDSLNYNSNWGGSSGGRSLERISSDTESGDSTNWGSSITIKRATPGNINSITQKEFDVLLSGLEIDPLFPVEGNDVLVSAVIKNFGLQPALNVTAEFYNDVNNDSLVHPNELAYTTTVNTIQTADSTTAIWLIPNVQRAIYNIIVKLDYSPDEFAENNTGIINFSVGEPPPDFNDLVINEIMFLPMQDEPEWIEVYNKSDKAWNLRDWVFSDRASKTNVTNKDILLEPLSFIVLSDDTSLVDFYEIPSDVVIVNLPSLNNTDDDLKLIDNSGRVIDSLNYKGSWSGFQPGISLERKLYTSPTNDSTNWGAADSEVKATPGKANSIVPKQFDLSIVGFNLSNEIVKLGDNVSGVVTIRNIGLSVAESAVLKIYRYVDENTNEQIEEIQLDKIIPDDSLNVPFDSGNFNIGENILIAEIYLYQDTSTANNIMTATFKCVEIKELPGDIVINEIMYAPVSPEPEWVEICNRSDKRINLEQYKIADIADTLLAAPGPLYLNPNEFFVFAKDSGFYETYPDIKNILIAKIPSLSNTSDQVKLLNYFDQVIDSVNYRNSWGYKTGISIERKDAEKSSNDSTNWGLADFEQGGSPGRRNSISPKDIDAAVINVSFMPELPMRGSDVNISTLIKNTGRNKILFSISLFEDTELDSISLTLVDRLENLSLSPGDSAAYNFNYILKDISTETGYLISIESDEDENPDNNTYYSSITPILPEGSIVINEIHYNPGDNEPEWFELFNNSDYEINLNKWTVEDVLTTPKLTSLSDGRLFLAPKSFIVFSKDSSVLFFHKSIPAQLVILNFANLNNDRDGVVIKDHSGRTIDSVMYDISVSGANGFSLERLNPNDSSGSSLNWSSSTDIEKSTPGRMNSIVQKNYDLMISRLLLDPAFPVFNEQVTPSVQIKNIGKNIAGDFAVSFSLVQNQVVTPLSYNTGITLMPEDSALISSNSSFLLNGTISLSVEIIYPLDEELSNDSADFEITPGFKQKSIIITEFMSQPYSGECEWIEFLNNSNDSINLFNWSVSDVLASPTKNKITNMNYLVAPGEFFIVCADTSKFIKDIAGNIFEVKFGALGNTEDGILIYDFNNSIIDSLFYDRTWSFIPGHSMERFSASEPSGEAYNWAPSLNLAGATPFTVNSICIAKEYEANSLVINEIMFDPSGGNSEFIEMVNTCGEDVDIGGWTIIDEGENYLRLANSNIVLRTGELFVIAADSTILDNYNYPEDFQSLRILNKSDLGLSNSGERLVLKDIKGNIIDSLNYNAKWHNRNIGNVKNISLERINPAINSNDPMNWSSSVNSKGATPGQTNSIYTERSALQSKFIVEPNPFSPDDDGFQDFAIISYKLKTETAQIRIKIFDDKGRKVRTLANNLPSASSGTVIFDGLDDDGRPLRIGMYIVLLEAFGRNSDMVEAKKCVVVIARKL